MEYLKIGLVIILGLFVIDRIGVWLESKGWIYWRKRGSGGMGNAFQEFDAFFRPSARHSLEIQQKKDTQSEDEQGGGKDSR